jgi:hypothetical protein
MRVRVDGPGTEWLDKGPFDNGSVVAWGSSLCVHEHQAALLPAPAHRDLAWTAWQCTPAIHSSTSAPAGFQPTLGHVLWESHALNTSRNKCHYTGSSQQTCTHEPQCIFLTNAQGFEDFK